MSSTLTYRDMTVAKGVEHVKSHYTATELKNISSFSDLHNLRDANVTLPFADDCGSDKWLAFANTVIEAFDQSLLQKTTRQ